MRDGNLLGTEHYNTRATRLQNKSSDISPQSRAFAGQLSMAARDQPHGQPRVNAHTAAARVGARGAEEGGAPEAQLI